jgi:hypothetical protein
VRMNCTRLAAARKATHSTTGFAPKRNNKDSRKVTGPCGPAAIAKATHIRQVTRVTENGAQEEYKKNCRTDRALQPCYSRKS